MILWEIILLPFILLWSLIVLVLIVATWIAFYLLLPGAILFLIVYGIYKLFN